MGITIFIPAPMPANEAARDREVRKTGVLQLRDINFLKIQCRSLCRHLNMDWCGVGIIHEDMNIVIASSGEMLGVYRRRTAFSSYVVYDPSDVFYVLDAKNDERFSGNPFVDDGLIMFYAGAAIISSNGFALGALSVTSKSSRLSFCDSDRKALAHCAKNISSALIDTLASVAPTQSP